MAMKEDTLEIEILDDGTIKVTSPKISAANHMNADQLLGFIAKLAGGETKIEKRIKSAHTHEHAHTHEENKA